MENAGQLVEQYFDAWTSKDFETARRLLRDDLEFKGPFESLDSADALMASITRLSEIVTGAERRGLVEQGDQVCVIYDLHTAPVPTTSVAEWYTVRDGKISSMEAFFDARPFAPMFEQA